MTAPIHRWVAEPPPADVERALSRLADSDDVVQIAAMPDVHLAAEVCVGCVTATRDTLYPEAVGGDIGCGMAAVRFAGRDAGALADRVTAARILHGFGARLPAGQHRSAVAALPADLDDRPLSAPALERLKRSIGRVQLATLGRGNHFAELQRDREGALWLMLHSGSRGLGQAIRDHHLAAATATRSGLRALDAGSPAGAAYLADLAWALDYARASRQRMVEAAAEVVAAATAALPDWPTYVDCHHNEVVREQHGGLPLWVHRKGAIAAAEGRPGIIPGSAGSASYHVTGRGHPDSLCSSSHGAGRAMSRGEAKRRYTLADQRAATEGVECRKDKDVIDEIPMAYKDIDAVMAAQKDLVEVVHTLKQVVCVKG
jgi:tRNA-splicing ligase RtcB (3'-phosphate/5'-hydroxy nucleic acid ligase)